MVEYDVQAANRKHLANYGLLDTASGQVGVTLNEHHITEMAWRQFNDLSEQKIDFGTISARIHVNDLPAVLYMDSARKCILKWGNDAQKVADCLSGKIDP